MLTKMRNWVLSHPFVSGFGAVGAGLLGFTASAGATATYDITPVTTSLSGELTSNVPIILAVVGALIALAIGVRMVRKFVKA